MKSNLIGGLLIVLVGVLLLFDSLAWIDIDFGKMFRNFWPLILVLIGLLIILSPGKGENTNLTDELGSSDGRSTDSNSAFLGAFGDIRVAGMECISGPLDKSLLVGDIVIDLRNSRLSPGEWPINASVLIGDVDFLVAPDCPVSVEFNCLAGSVACGGKVFEGFVPRLKHVDDNFPQAAAKLKITGRTLIGDIKLSKA